MVKTKLFSAFILMYLREPHFNILTVIKYCSVLL